MVLSWILIRMKRHVFFLLYIFGMITIINREYIKASMNSSMETLQLN